MTVAEQSFHRPAQLATIQAYREGEIQRMYDKLEMLWAVMNISTVDIENFVELNQGISEQSVLVVRLTFSLTMPRRKLTSV